MVNSSHLTKSPCCSFPAESITALPSLGIQFTTQRAYTLPGYHHALIVYPSSTTTIFIPLPSFRPRGGTGADAVFVHEGLQRWGIRYYLGLLWDAQWRAGGHDVEKRETADSWQVQVGFPVSCFSSMTKCTLIFEHGCRTFSLVCQSCGKSIMVCARPCSTTTRPRHRPVIADQDLYIYEWYT